MADQEFIKIIIIIGMSLILRMVIAQITKFLKVGFEVMDACDLFSLVTSLKMFEKQTVMIFCHGCFLKLHGNGKEEGEGGELMKTEKKLYKTLRRKFEIKLEART